MDDAVDSLNMAVKLYVTRMTRDSLDDRDGYRAMEIISFSINLEHVGDIIDKNLMDLASKKIRRGITFSKEGEADLVEFHQQVVNSLTLAIGIFMSGDMDVARQLVAAKAQLREREFASGRAVPRTLARGDAGNDRVVLAGSGHSAGSEANSLAPVFGRVSRPRARGSAAAQPSQRSRVRPAESREPPPDQTTRTVNPLRLP